MKSRISTLGQAFTSFPITIQIDGIPTILRPLTAGSMQLLMESGNPLFSDKKEEELDQPEYQLDGRPVEKEKGDEMTAADLAGFFQFIYIHTAPIAEVIEASEDPQILRRKSKQLSLKISLDQLGTFAEQFGELTRRMAAAQVEIVPESEAGKHQGEQPPTGSPESSTPSEAPAIPSASDGSSGGCHSIERSNTSTPPTTQMEQPVPGRSRIWEDSPEPVQPAENVIPMP